VKCGINMGGGNGEWNATTDDVTETCGDVTSAVSCSAVNGSSGWSSNATKYLSSDDIRPVTLAIYLITFVFGLVGNTLVIYVIGR